MKVRYVISALCFQNLIRKAHDIKAKIGLMDSTNILESENNDVDFVVPYTDDGGY